MPLNGSDRPSRHEEDAALEVDRVEPPSKDWYALPALVGASILLVSLMAAMMVRDAENRSLEAAVDAALDTITTEIEQGIDRQLYGVIILAWRWDWRDGNARELWVAEARKLIDELPLLQSILWLDGDHQVLVREPSFAGGREGLFLSEESETLKALQLAADKRKIIGTITDDSAQNKILMVHIALHKQGVSRGFAIGTYALESLLSKIFVSEPTGFRVEVSDGGGPIWRSAGETLFDVPVRHGTSSTLNLDLDISVSPEVRVVNTYRTWLPMAIGLGGGFFGLLTGLALYMGVDSRRKAQRLQLSNLRLREEMTLRGRAEKVMTETEAELVETLNSLPVHVWSAKISDDGEYRPRRMSTVLAGISGRPLDFFDGSPEAWLQVIHAEDRPRLAEMIEEVLAGRREKADFEYRLVRADGAIRYMSDSVRTTYVESGRRLDGVSRDVTEVKESEEERLRLEERFQQAQKLDSLGVLAGGIAHDFNNLLVAMLGHARLAEEDLPPESPIQHNLKSVIKAARQAGELCGQMLAYAGKVPIDTKAIELDEIVEEIGELLRASIPSSTLIRYSFDKEVPCLRGDASQVRQVALNLMTNASESIGENGGEIMLRVQTTEYDSAGLAEMEFSEALEPGPYVVLTVSDTGCGMDGSIRTKIFEPFYTTKFAGRGLGLAAVVGIVRGHGGALRIESEIGQGSSISVIFPALDGAAATEADVAGDESRPWRGAMKVLLVEDEEAARELARIVLERSGIEVVEATDGVEALAIFRLQPEIFDCVLLDLTMPNMDGVETYARLQKIRPDIPVILCSGYPESAAYARFADLGLSGFLKKPYEPEELIACLHALGPPSASV